MKAYIEIGEATNAIIELINSGAYKTMLEACNGETKEDGFRGAMFILPAIMLHYCNVIYIKDKEGKNGQD